MTSELLWDLFISHADVDKESIVLPLAEALREKGIRVWLDRWTISMGDSIMQSVSEGLAQSRYGIVVLSEAFFSRPWPMKELAALFALENAGASRILPIWHRIDQSHVHHHAPLLADKMAARSDEGVPTIVDKIVRVLDRQRNNNPNLNPEAVRALTRRLFPHLQVDEFWQADLLAHLDVTLYRSVSDIERAYRRARLAVHAFARERPDLFHSGTDYLTKSMGFVDLCYRSRHNWASATRTAFERHADKIVWNIT